MNNPSDPVRIQSIDMSLREPGFCFLTKEGNSKTINDCYFIKNQAPDASKFRKLELDAASLAYVMIDLKRKEEKFNPHVIIVELPCFTQTATAALSIGMVWGVFADYFSKDNFVAVEPSALKVWSKSKKGDKKEKVLETVLARVPMTSKKMLNNNVIDAIGLALMFCDLVDEY